MRAANAESLRQPRQGFLLALVAIIVVALDMLTPLAPVLRHSRLTQRLLVTAATVATAYGSYLLVRYYATISKWRLAVSCVTAFFLALAIAAYALYNLIPIKYLMLWRPLDYASWLSEPCGGSAAILSLFSSFFTSSKSRLLFVIASVLVVITW